MPATLAPAAAPAQGPGAAAPPGSSAKQVVLPNPFTRGSSRIVERFIDQSVQMTASSQNQGPFAIPATGWLRHIWLLVEATGGAGGAAVVAKFEDAPWSALQNITLTDANGKALTSPIDGFDLFLINKYGAFVAPPNTDPGSMPEFSDVIAGNVANKGNFTFAMRIPVELVARDALGALPNQAAQQPYQLQFSVSPSSRVYTVAPETLPTLRIRAQVESWAPPPAADLRGVPNATTPPAAGTTQFFSKTSFNLNAGDQRIRLPRVGNLIRQLICIVRNGTPVRDTTVWPDPVRIEWDLHQYLDELRTYRRRRMRELWGFNGDTGVIVYDFTHDLDETPGDELRDQYLATTQATRLELVGTFGAGSLTIITNDVSPAGSLYTWEQ